MFFYVIRYYLTKTVSLLCNMIKFPIVIFNLYDREDKGFLTQSSFQQFNQSSDSIIPEPFRDYFSKV